MPLIPCPDCGRDVSATAPACIHCGRPMAPPSAPAAEPKPVAGIAAVLVIGGIAIARTLAPGSPPANPDVADLRALSRGVQVMGNGAAIIGALMAMMGNRGGSRVVRAASLAMIPVSLAVAAFAWALLRRVPGAGAAEVHAPLVLLGVALAVAGVVPWLIFLFLFMRSRYG